MKLAAIYNVWDGDELMYGSMSCIKDHVDVFIVVYQNISNFGEVYHPNIESVSKFNPVCIEYKPKYNGGIHNEKVKRQTGIDKAKELGCTHFILMDCDEYYNPEQFKSALEYTDKGSVCKLITYFNKPTIRLENPEGYYVPFVHPLKPTTTISYWRYPFYTDPTRSINDTDIVEIPESICVMHHYSWVRKDIGKKIRNSSAQGILKNSGLLLDYERSLKHGDYLSSYDQKVIEVENIFNILV